MTSLSGPVPRKRRLNTAQAASSGRQSTCDDHSHLYAQSSTGPQVQNEVAVSGRIELGEVGMDTDTQCFRNLSSQQRNRIQMALCFVQITAKGLIC